MRVIQAAEQRPWRRTCPTCGHVIEPTLTVVPDIEPEVTRRVADVCGATMPKTGEACGRRAGHQDAHRSRYVMDGTARRRRATNRRKRPW